MPPGRSGATGDAAAPSRPAPPGPALRIDRRMRSVDWTRAMGANAFMTFSVRPFDHRFKS